MSLGSGVSGIGLGLRGLVKKYSAYFDKLNIREAARNRRKDDREAIQQHLQRETGELQIRNLL